MALKPNSGKLLQSMRRSAIAAGADILAKPNVQFATIGQKRVGGRRTNEAAVVVYVSRKADVDPAERISPAVPHIGRSAPRQIKTDVIELLSPPRSFAARSGNVVIASDQKYGVCTISFVKNGRRYLLTNAHVGCDVSQGGAFCQMSLLPPNTNQTYSVGSTIWSSGLAAGTIAYSDAAIVSSDNMDVDAYYILNMPSPINGMSHFVPGNTVYWFVWNGVVFNCAYPEYITSPANIDVDGTTIQYDDFWVLQMTSGAASPGQSGALICRTDNGVDAVACGIVFGGSAPNLIFAFSFDSLFTQVYSAIP